MLCGKDRLCRGAGGLAFALLLGGCTQSLVRSDRLIESGGDSIAANRAIQMIDPWPKSSFPEGQVTQGARIGAAMDRYGSGRSIASPDAASSASAASKTTN